MPLCAGFQVNGAAGAGLFGFGRAAFADRSVGVCGITVLSLL